MDSALPPIVPYLTVKDVRSVLEFYARAFGAETLMLLEDGNGVYPVSYTHLTLPTNREV